MFNKRPQLTTVEKKTLFLSLPYFGEVSLQKRTKLRKSLKGLLNSCELQIVFKSQRKLSNVFLFIDLLHFGLVFGVVYKYTYGRCNSTYYAETDRHLKARSREHIEISPLIFKKTKPSKESAIRDHLLNCNNIPFLRSLPFWKTELINSLLKLRKACLWNEIALFQIKTLLLLNCLFLIIVTFLIVSLHSNNA